MKSKISEFSYGYALTSEIVQKCGTSLAGAPVFPSLIAEGSLGYDLKLPIVGSPVFLQFKLSDHMVRSTAEGADKVPIPHYRMHLMPLKHSQQHNLLLALEKKGNKVFYAAPEFHKATELNKAFLGNQIIERSAFFRPNAIGSLPDEHEHFVCFNIGSTHGYVYSEPVKVEKERSEAVVETLTGQALDKVATNLPARVYLERVANELVSEWAEITASSQEKLDLLDEIRVSREPPEYLGWVARALFDCTVFVRLQRKSGQAGA
jgi:hypothetical protein